MPDLDRRGFLLGSGALLLLAACGDGDDDDTTTTTEAAAGPSTTAAAEGAVLVPAFNRNSFLQAGIPQRAAFGLFDSSGGFLAVDQAPAELTFTATSEGQEATGTVARHGDELDRPYYPVGLTLPGAGPWNVATSLPDGTTLTIDVLVSESVTFPQIGDAVPSTATPTVDDDLGVGTICTRTPPCPFHEVSLDDAVAAGRPVAVLMSTPAYCQVAICGPVLDLLVGADPGEVAVIHVEVFPNGSGTEPGAASEILTEGFGLDFEPVLYVADAGGTITARLDSIYDSTELDAALRSAAG